MKYPTLGTGQLFEVNRNRYDLMLANEKRKTFLLVCAITACVTIVTTIWIVYG